MLSQLDLGVYKVIMPNMKATELYMGAVTYPFYYSKVGYEAKCTEGIPFDPFDKVICELLKVEDSLSFEEIGDILGLNVYDDRNNGKILDYAEHEILAEAIQSLSSEEFGQMVEPGDIAMSKCRLTSIGREYAEKHFKFKVTENKPFDLFFDHTTGLHQEAQENFEFIKRQYTSTNFDTGVNDKEILKSIAAKQVPDIYDPERYLSFTNAEIVSQEFFETQLPLALTYDALSKEFKFYCLNANSKGIHGSFTKWINLEDEKQGEILNAFLVANNAPNGEIYSSYLVQLKESALNETVELNANQLMAMPIIEEPVFVYNINKFINEDEATEVFLSIPEFSPVMNLAIGNIAQQLNHPESKLFLVFPEMNDSLEDQTAFDQIMKIAKASPKVYVIHQQVKDLFFGIKSPSFIEYFDFSESNVMGIRKGFFHRKPLDERCEGIMNHILEEMANNIGAEIASDITQYINENLSKKWSLEIKDKLLGYESRLKPITGLGNKPAEVDEALLLISQYRKNKTEEIIKDFQNKISKIQNSLIGPLTEETISGANLLLQQIDLNLVQADQNLRDRYQFLRIEIDKKRSAILDATREFYFVLDTNILLKDSSLIERLDPKHKVVIAAKVLDELNNFKRKKESSAKASQAISKITQNKFKNIRRMRANLKVLPPDFSKKSPDNMILSVAKSLSKKNVLLVTDENGLLEKCRFVDVNGIKLKEFINRFIKK